jgi:tRNA-dihydrouridine synthase C
MLGRGMVRDPGLALKIRDVNSGGVGWEEMLTLLARFWETVSRHNQPRHQAGRLKQWLNFLRKRYPEAEEVYASIRTVNDPAEVGRMLFGESRRLAA